MHRPGFFFFVVVFSCDLISSQCFSFAFFFQILLVTSNMTRVNVYVRLTGVWGLATESRPAIWSSTSLDGPPRAPPGGARLRAEENKNQKHSLYLLSHNFFVFKYQAILFFFCFALLGHVLAWFSWQHYPFDGVVQTPR